MENSLTTLETRLTSLRMPFIKENYCELAKDTTSKGLGHIDYLTRLIDGECAQRNERRIKRLISQARFPIIKTLDQFDFTHPKRLDRAAVQYHFQLDFARQKQNLIFIGGCGLGKTHLAIALGYHACHHGYRVLFTPAVDMINNLAEAQAKNAINAEMKKYLKPDILIIDELGYLPIDKFGADLLFQIISNRYERGSIMLTSNRVFKEWPEIFNNDTTLTSAVLDRILHHHELILVEGKSYRMRKPME